MRRAILLPAALLVLAACHEAAPPPEGRSLPPAAETAAAVPGSAVLAVRDGAGRAGPFRITDLPRLALDASYASLEPGRHEVRIDVLAPVGTLYAQLRGTVHAGEDGSGTSAHRLEVQGTPIETFRQVGRWRFALSVDGASFATTDADLLE